VAKPTFIVVGAMKCATTTLCDLLSKHPDIFFSNPKEPDFFCRNEIYQRGTCWYEALFQCGESKKAIGEGSTSYTNSYCFPRLPSDWRKFCPTPS
jgi:hypothetical protein